METGLSETQRGAPRPLATRTPLGPHRRHQNGRQRLAALGDVVVPARQQRRRRGAPVAPRLALAARGLRRDDRAPAPTTRSTTTIWRASVFSCPIPRSPEENAHQEILYEEYHPYGTSAYRASNGSVDVSARRYRYTGKERDEETGLYYNGARYLAAWLGRWTAADPIGIGADGPGLYNYTRGSPVNYTDPSGTDTLEDLWRGASGVGRGYAKQAKGAWDTTRYVVDRLAKDARWLDRETLTTAMHPDLARFKANMDAQKTVEVGMDIINVVEAAITGPFKRAYGTGEVLTDPASDIGDKGEAAVGYGFSLTEIAGFLSPWAKEGPGALRTVEPPKGPAFSEIPGGAGRKRGGGPPAAGGGAHVQQCGTHSCGAASGEMAARAKGAAVTEAELMAQPEYVPPPQFPEKLAGFNGGPLAAALERTAPIPGREWMYRDFYPSMKGLPTTAQTEAALADALKQGGGSIVARTDLNTHWLVVDSMEGGILNVRDPATSAASTMTLSEFSKRWMGTAVVSRGKQ